MATKVYSAVPTASPNQKKVQTPRRKIPRIKVAPPWDKKKKETGLEVKFGVILSEALKDGRLPSQLVDMLVFIARDGVTTTDVFRRNGNNKELKTIIEKMEEGEPVDFSKFNFYTLASVLKKFLLMIPGGIFGPEVEASLLDVLEIDNKMEKYDRIHSIISSLPQATQQLLSLLFGTWFRIVNHSEYNTMSSEAVAKSVAGSLFHTCACSKERIEKAVQVLQILIDDFGVASMFGRKNIQYFANKTNTNIRVREKFKYEYRLPVGGDSVPYDQSHVYIENLLEEDAEKRGICPRADAITEEQFYGGAGRGRRDTKESIRSATDMTCSPPSPRSLQPEMVNTHQPLTHTSSISAPDVNKDPSQEMSTNLFLSTSHSSFEKVQRRQKMQMAKRREWFLSPSAKSGARSGSVSREPSVGKSSMDATSSEGLLSDVTASDGAISDKSASEHFHHSHAEIDNSYDDNLLNTPDFKPRHHHHHGQHHLSDELNGNHHRTSTPAKYSQQTTFLSTTSSNTPPSRSRSPSPRVNEKEVRYYLVENLYHSSFKDTSS